MDIKDTIKPKLRRHAEIQINSALKTSIGAILKDESIFQSCITCHFFEEITEKCKIAGSRPPARVIVYGCPKYVERSTGKDLDDEIPF